MVGTANFMQNSPVAKPPAQPQAADKPALSKNDFSLEPLPVPDATESDTDTAWGLWQQTLQSQEEDSAPSDFADTVLSQDTIHGTIPADLGPDGKKP